MAAVTPIPEPPRLPFLGHVGEFTSSPVKDLTRLGDTYGDIYRLYLGGRTTVFVSSNELVNEVCDEKRFNKVISLALTQVRNGVHDGLFTAHDGEENWGKAHRVLVPAFGPLSIRGMFDDMHDIATQLCMKWARHGPQKTINVTDDFTRLALDTLALCAMDYRFNSYYSEEMHPFIQAMGDFLAESGRRSRRPALVPDFMYRAANQKYEADIEIMRQTADAVVESRKKNPSNRKDLLTAMLDGVDPETGTKLDDANITDQLITFLIAGHETTAGMMSFAMFHLLRSPSAYQKVKEEVDRVVGRETLKPDHVPKLPYIAAVLRETLRIAPTIASFVVGSKEDTVIGGKYFVSKGEPIVALTARAHRDPVVYGEDAAEFKPERMLEESFNRLNEEYPNCWKPFGNGKRSCIGRPFAWQEAILCVAMLFQNFTFSLDDPSYQLETQEALTVKPKGFNIRASLRHGMTPTELEHHLAGKPVVGIRPAPAGSGSATPPSSSAPGNGKEAGKESRRPMAVYYGSNSGTCEALAQRLASDAPTHGFDVTEIGPLDLANGKVPKDRPVVIVTSSYEGQPPSNASHFVTWLQGLQGRELEGVSYAVFGCGHHDWVRTFQRIPKLVDSTMQERGGDRIVPITTTDVADRDIFSDFEAWEDESLWPALRQRYGAKEEADAGTGGGLTVEVLQPRKSTLRQDVEEALVVDARLLTAPESVSAKRHVEIQLPTGMTYRSGDYLAVLPINPKAAMARVFRRFQLSWDAFVKIDSDRPTTLPTGSPISASDVLGAYVELGQPATKRNILTLAEATQDADVAKELEGLAGDQYQQEISAKHVSVIDLLERYPSIQVPLATYLSMLPPMRVRQYSISSSPLANPSNLTLTFSVLDRPHISGQGQHLGVASNFLSTLNPGERLHVSIRSSAAFHLPTDAEKTPIICAAAGSGLAPFRGFIQERAAMVAAGRRLAPALLFFGCRSPADDDLYADELARWESLGAVSVRRAYSRAPQDSFGCRYVQHRMLHDRQDISALWDRGAKLYVCGGKEVGKAVQEACVEIATLNEKDKGREVTREEVDRWIGTLRNERYITDVFD